jgi:separase
MAARGTASTRPGRPTKATTISADKLAEQLASGLTISNEKKGKQKASPLFLSEEDIRLSAMRSVNSASQALSAMVQSGWKRSLETPSSTQTLVNANASTVTVNKGLAVLRQMCPDDVDVERAAVSVLGKLVALELVRDNTLSYWNG